MILNLFNCSYNSFNKKTPKILKFDQILQFRGRIVPPQKISMSTKVLKIDSYTCFINSISITKILNLFNFSYNSFYKKNTENSQI